MNKTRVIILNTAIIFGFFAVFFRLVDLMAINHEHYSEKAKLQQIKSEDIQVRRGTIYDRKGRELAVNLELESLYCDPEEVDLDFDSMTKLSRILDVRPKIIQAKLSHEKRFAWINRKLTPDTAHKIRELGVSGCGFIPEAKRFYPKDKLASHVVGAVGLDNQALEGIELKYDKYLKAPGGKVLFARDARGNILSSGVDMEARGNNILLTIDEGLQYIVEKEIEKARARWKAAAASAVMMDPYTGEILALANSPSYDPNTIGSTNKNSIRNRGITDIYEPGSTFKVIVGSAALEEKLFNLNSLFDCRKGSIEVGGKIIRDAHRQEEVLTFKEVIQKSSNVGSIMIGMELGKERVYRYAKRFGFGELTGIDLPGEVSGWIRKPEQWSGVSIGAISIGQEVAVTPLQVLRAYTAIANGGYLVKPHVVSEIRSPDGQTVYAFASENRERAISSQTAFRFKEILKTVVEEGGTAAGAAVMGDQVAGKTGTAQMIDSKTGRYSKEKYISSFVGFVPADKPQIALIVIVYEPKGQHYGGIVAGPVFRSIAEQSLSYMNVPMEDGRMKKMLLVSQ